jgi:hypothetical protein
MSDNGIRRLSCNRHSTSILQIFRHLSDFEITVSFLDTVHRQAAIKPNGDEHKLDSGEIKMTRFTKIALACMTAASAFLSTVPANAQLPIQQVGFDRMYGPICASPIGTGPCNQVAARLQQMMGPPGAMGVPTGIVPRDGQITAMIAQNCGGNPKCMAAAWASVEVQRCAQGFGVPGGCFGPNGEIMKVINRFVPQNLQPNVIIRNIDNDRRNGPGETNDLVGKKGFVCRTFFGGC